MNISRLLMVSAIVVTVSAPAMAQTAVSETQRDVNQQNRIEQGLQSGELTTKEAGKLENGEKRIDKVEAKDMKDGTLSPAEKARIQAMQNKESSQIKSDKSNAKTGNPESASSERMQADVARDVNQEKRINEGLKSGEMTKTEAAKSERSEAKTDRAEARAARNGRVGKAEEAKITKDENGASKKIYGRKHNARVKG